MAALTRVLVFIGIVLMLVGGGVLLLAVWGDPRPFANAQAATNSSMSFARAFLGIGMMMAGCFCAILARIAQAAEQMPVAVTNVMNHAGAPASQVDTEREVARLMRESASSS